MKQKKQYNLSGFYKGLHRVLNRYLVLGCLLVPLTANAYAQEKTVTLNSTDTPLSEVLSAIKQQTNVSIFYNDEQVDVTRKVSVQANNMGLDEALDQILSPLQMSHQFINDTYVISNFRSANVPTTAQQRGTPVISGIVTDAKGKPVAGVSVFLKSDKRTGAITDSNGKYTISPSVEEGLLEFEFLGMKSQTFAFNGSGTHNVTLEEDALEIEGLIVTGYINKNRDSFTGTALQVTGKELQNINPVKLFDALKVVDPSFSVMDQEGLFGSNPNHIPERIDIRGQNSMPDISEGTLSTYTSLPIFILDGFEVRVEQVYDLDMNRIKTLTVLKDAAASAIYGSRAANGVVVIETLSPETGKLRVRYNVTLGLETPDLTSLNMMDASELLEYYRRSQLFNNGDKGDNTASNIYENLIGGNPGRQNLFMLLSNEVAHGVNSYWLSQPVRTAFNHDHSLSIEGGTQLLEDRDLRYMINLRANPDQGAMKGSFRDRYDAGLKLIYNTNKLQMVSDIQFSRADYANSPYGDYSTYVNLLPFYRMRDENGEYHRILSYHNIPIYEGFPTPNFTGNIFSDQANPLYEATRLSSYDKGNNTAIMYNLGLNWRPVDSFLVKGTFSINSTESKSQRFVSPFAPDFYDPETVTGGIVQGYNINYLYRRGTYTMSNTSQFAYTGKLMVSYMESFNRHNIQAVLGGEVKQDDYETDSYSVIGFMDDNMGYPSYAAMFKPDSGPGGNKGIERSAGIFMNINYDWDNRYLFDLTGRMDGSSGFASRERTALFWSAGVRWNINREKFMDNVDFIDVLALRANVGTTGNQNLRLSEIMTLYRFSDSYNNVTSAEIMSLANDALKWQTTLNRNVGIVLSFFKRKVNFEGNIYKNTTKDNVTNISLPLSTGFATFKANQGDVENRGYEFSLTLTPVNTERWMVGGFFNGSHNKNKLMKLSDSLKEYNELIKSGQSSTSAVTSSQVDRVFLFDEGISLNAIWAVPSLGIDPATGKEIFLNRNGGKTFVWDPNDQVVVGVDEPALRGHFGLNLRYERLLLSTSFAYSFGSDKYNSTLYSKIEGGKFDVNMDRRALYDRWFQPGDVAKYRSLNNLSLRYTSSRFVQKENYLALSSVSLSYTMSQKVADYLGMSMLMFRFTCNDLFYESTIYRERGISYPFTRQFNFSIQANF